MENLAIVENDSINKNKTPDTRYLTYLSVLSCIAVIYLHTNSCFWIFEKNARWITANVIECLFYFAVPVFFMISGATLLDYRNRYDTKTYVKKRIFKTLIPFIVWSLIWCIARDIDGQFPWKGDVPFYKFVLEGIFNNGFYSNYWFFIPLFTCYASFIVFSLIPETYKQKIFLFMIAAGFITISALPFVFNVLNVVYNNDLKFPISGGGYLMFALFGYYINKYEIKFSQRIVLYCLGIAGFLTHLLGTQFASFKAGQIVQTYKGYLNVPCVLYSASVFIFFKYVKKVRRFTFLYKIFKFISPLTFGVYLLHGFLLDFFNKLPLDSSHILFRVFGSLGVFALSGFIVWIMRQIPIIKKIVP